jgi:protein-S-isoprenylcysteine O-methyltransferase Ste14
MTLYNSSSIRKGIDMKNLIPIILSPILFLLILALALIRLKNQSIWDESIFNFDIAFVSTYLLWIIIESKVSIKEMDKGKETHDFGTCELYAMGQAAVFLSALWFKSVWQSPNIFLLLGFLIFLFGGIYRLWAIRTLGKYYSHIVRKVDGHKIVDSGPYRFIRHPAYAGMILANLGIVIYFFNLTTCTIYFFVFIPAIVLRILVEEKTLFSIDGYSKFAKERKRLIPAIW